MATECATQAINLNKEYSKPVISRANSHYELEKYEEAYEDYQTVDKLDPSIIQKSADLKRKFADCRRRVEELTEKRKTEVMSGLKDLGNTLLGKFGMSLDNFKLQQNEGGSYNISFQK